MNYRARLSQRTVKQLGKVTPAAHWQVSRQLGEMQCKRKGHVPGKSKSVGAYRRMVAVCQRCFKVIETQPGQSTEEVNDGTRQQD